VPASSSPNGYGSRAVALFGAAHPAENEMFQLGEDLLDGVEIGRVGRQEYSLGAGGAKGVPNRL